MPRLLIPTLLAIPLFGVAFLTGAAAQADPGCGATAASACPWVVSVDTEGFLTGYDLNVTQGEWIRITVDNLDEATHTLTLSGYPLDISVPSYGTRNQTFQATAVGDFTLRDMPSQDTGILTVLPAGTDVVSHDEGLGDTTTGGPSPTSGSSPTTKGAPMLPAALAAVALAGVAAARGRR